MHLQAAVHVWNNHIPTHEFYICVYRLMRKREILEESLIIFSFCGCESVKVCFCLIYFQTCNETAFFLCCVYKNVYKCTIEVYKWPIFQHFNINVRFTVQNNNSSRYLPWSKWTAKSVKYAMKGNTNIVQEIQGNCLQAKSF